MKELKLIEGLKGTAYRLVENKLIWLHVKCTDCGRELVLDDKRTKKIAGTSECQCHLFKPASFNVARFQQRPEYKLCLRRCKLKRLLITSGYPQDSATLADVLAQVGARPEPSEAFQYFLTIASSPIENPHPRFKWKKVLQSSAIDSAMSRSRLSRYQLTVRLRSFETDEAIKRAKTGLIRYHEKDYRYEQFRGKTLRGVTIINIFSTVYAKTTVCYVSYRCTRCGFQGTMPAYRALYKDQLCCRKCGKSANFRMHYHRNSAVARSNPFNRLSQKSSRELATAALALQLGAREYVSQYSLDASDFEKVYERCELDMYWGWP